MRVTCQRIGNLEWRLIRFGWFSPVRLTINCSIETERETFTSHRQGRRRGGGGAAGGAPRPRRRSQGQRRQQQRRVQLEGVQPHHHRQLLRRTRGRRRRRVRGVSAAAITVSQREKENRVCRYYRSFMIFNDIDSTDFMFYGK